MKKLFHESMLQIKDILFITHDMSEKKISKKAFVLLLTSFFVIICRFISMWHMPDVFCDEQDILNHMQSILTTGYDSNGYQLPLFPKVGAGLATYTYLYPMMFFLSFIGVSPVRARLVQQLLTICACFLTALGIKIWSGNRNIFWITFLTGISLPWGFVQANRIWDPCFVPIYFSIYFFFFVLLMKKQNPTSFQTYLYAIVAFVNLVFLATVYPPARIPAVGMWIYSLIWAIRNKRIKKNHIVMIMVVSSLAALPLALNLLNPEFNERSTTLLIFNQNITGYQQIHLFFKSLGELFNPVFLFISGDAIYRHSLPIFGMLGTASIIPLFTQIRAQKQPSIIYYMLFIIIMTYISVSLTYDYQPHGLRSCLAWPAFVIIISHGWSKFFKNRDLKFHIVWFTILVACFVLYFISFILIHNGIITLYV